MFCWTVHLPGGPGRWNHAAVAVEHEVYCFGGGLCRNERTQLCVHVFNTLSLRWRKLPLVAPGRGEHQPSRRRGHTAVLIEDTVYLWGGDAQVYIPGHVLYAFDVDTHRCFKPKVSGTVPEGRKNHSACVLGKVMYIHGGSVRMRCTNEIYRLDTTSMVWSLVNTIGRLAAPLSELHSATIIGTKMFVFGGYNRQYGSFYYYNIRVFDTETNCWLNTPSVEYLPERPRGHSAFTYNGELYIYGGRTQQQNVNDLWKKNPETFCWKKVEPKGKGPSPVDDMSCVLVGDRVVLFADDHLFILDLSPGLKTLCKLVVIQYGLEQSELPHNIRWELAAVAPDKQMYTSSQRRTK